MINCQDIKNDIDRYLHFNFYLIEGYISRLDAAIIRELICAQVSHGITGSLVEIGVHYGRSFFLLALGRSASEKCLAIDLFEDDSLYKNREGVGRLGGFVRNCEKYGFALSEDEVVKRSSLDISADEILNRVGPARFFSIDGGHMYEHVANDLRLAENVLTVDGIICMDDIFCPYWPEAGIACFDWLRKQRGRFAPFLATNYKLYVCNSSRAHFYLESIRNDRKLKRHLFRSISLFSHEVLVFLPTTSSKAAERVIGSLISTGRHVHLPSFRVKNRISRAPI